MLGSKSTALIIHQTWWFLYESREFKSCNPSLLAAEVLGRSRPRSESVDFLRRISPVLLQVHGINRSWGYQPDQPHQKWLPNNGWLINPYSCGCPWLLVFNTLFRSRSIIWGVTSVLSWGTGWCELGLFFFWIEIWYRIRELVLVLKWAWTIGITSYLQWLSNLYNSIV